MNYFKFESIFKDYTNRDLRSEISDLLVVIKVFE